MPLNPQVKKIIPWAASALGAGALDYASNGYDEPVSGKELITRLGIGGLNTALLGLGARKFRHGYTGIDGAGKAIADPTKDLLAGTGLIAAIPTKDLALQAIPAVNSFRTTADTLRQTAAELPGQIKNMQGSSAGKWLAGALGLGALGLGGAALYKYWNQPEQVAGAGGAPDKGRVKVTLPTLHPGDAETTLDLPLESPYMTDAMRRKLRRDLRSRVRLENKVRDKKINPETGEKMPYIDYVQQFGSDEEKKELAEDMAAMQTVDPAVAKKMDRELQRAKIQQAAQAANGPKSAAAALPADPVLEGAKNMHSIPGFNSTMKPIDLRTMSPQGEEAPPESIQPAGPDPMQAELDKLQQERLKLQQEVNEMQLEKSKLELDQAKERAEVENSALETRRKLEEKIHQLTLQNHELQTGSNLDKAQMKNMFDLENKERDMRSQLHEESQQLSSSQKLDSLKQKAELDKFRTQTESALQAQNEQAKAKAQVADMQAKTREEIGDLHLQTKEREMQDALNSQRSEAERAIQDARSQTEHEFSLQDAQQQAEEAQQAAQGGIGMSVPKVASFSQVQAHLAANGEKIASLHSMIKQAAPVTGASTGTPYNVPQTGWNNSGSSYGNQSFMNQNNRPAPVAPSVSTIGQATTSPSQPIVNSQPASAAQVQQQAVPSSMTGQVSSVPGGQAAPAKSPVKYLSDTDTNRMVYRTLGSPDPQALEGIDEKYRNIIQTSTDPVAIARAAEEAYADKGSIDPAMRGYLTDMAKYRALTNKGMDPSNYKGLSDGLMASSGEVMNNSMWKNVLNKVFLGAPAAIHDFVATGVNAPVIGAQRERYRDLIEAQKKIMNGSMGDLEGVYQSLGLAKNQDPTGFGLATNYLKHRLPVISAFTGDGGASTAYGGLDPMYGVMFDPNSTLNRGKWNGEGNPFGFHNRPMDYRDFAGNPQDPYSMAAVENRNNMLMHPEIFGMSKPSSVRYGWSKEAAGIPDSQDARKSYVTSGTTPASPNPDASNVDTAVGATKMPYGQQLDNTPLPPNTPIPLSATGANLGGVTPHRFSSQPGFWEKALTAAGNYLAPSLMAQSGQEPGMRKWDPRMLTIRPQGEGMNVPFANPFAYRMTQVPATYNPFNPASVGGWQPQPM